MRRVGERGACDRGRCRLLKRHAERRVRGAVARLAELRGFAAVSLPFFSSPSALGRLMGSCAGAVGSSAGRALLLFATSFVGSCRPDPGVVSGLGRRSCSPEALFPRAACFGSSGRRRVSLGVRRRCRRSWSRAVPSGFGVSSGSACPRRRSRAGRVRSERSAGSFRALPAGSPSGGRTLSGGFVSPEGASPLPSSGGVFPTGGTVGNPPQGLFLDRRARWVLGKQAQAQPFPVSVPVPSSLRVIAAGRGRTRPRALSRNRTAW